MMVIYGDILSMCYVYILVVVERQRHNIYMCICILYLPKGQPVSSYVLRAFNALIVDDDSLFKKVAALASPGAKGANVPP